MVVQCPQFHVPDNWIKFLKRRADRAAWADSLLPRTANAIEAHYPNRISLRLRWRVGQTTVETFTQRGFRAFCRRGRVEPLVTFAINNPPCPP
jgi:hypothetical protein